MTGSDAARRSLFRTTTLFAIALRSPDYEALWSQLGGLYTGNPVLGLLPTPDLLQTLGSALRNTGLIGMGGAALQREPPLAAAT